MYEKGGKGFTLVTNSVISSVLVTSSVSREVTVLTVVVEAKKTNTLLRSFVLKTIYASIFTFSNFASNLKRMKILKFYCFLCTFTNYFPCPETYTEKCTGKVSKC
jgi:hypothetical protein